ncbi:arsenite methyltransferase [Sulfoacidibacillus ferrooxidans]|uniref:Arsenite methyltransferase n=1 Tax=Sulfoacidibacillus ferrooxidans TaxID=2005001 RepID=A0A9X1V6M8_9BACL|nr:arsenite methyltransferase [Sulfoacidibacillus ferrooxidans]MCI0181969.1 Arsenite methyltransferase [Sulfoacidibacillus ferrooxidans]
MDNLEQDQIRAEVRKHYSGVATRDSGESGCSTTNTSCCGSSSVRSADEVALKLGYGSEELSVIPEGANMGLGCGSPTKIAKLQRGEVALDLGSGGGFDCFIAAKQVGEQGAVIGVDMTPEMIAKARQLAHTNGYYNVEFRLGEIEHLPVADQTVDVVMSNCVINLSPNKLSVFKEAFRVLKPGGRVAISDVVASAALPEEMKADLTLLSECVSGAAPREDIELMLHEAGFHQIAVISHDAGQEVIKDWVPGSHAEDYVQSASITAKKPE